MHTYKYIWIQLFSGVQLFATLWTVVYQAPLSMGFCRKGYGVDCHFLLQGTLGNRTQVSQIAGRHFTVWATREEDLNKDVGSQEIPEVTGKLGLGVQNEAEQKLIEFCHENTLVIANTSCNNRRDDSTHEHHQRSILKSLLPKTGKHYTVSKTRPGTDCG